MPSENNEEIGLSEVPSYHKNNIHPLQQVMSKALLTIINEAE